MNTLLLRNKLHGSGIRIQAGEGEHLLLEGVARVVGEADGSGGGVLVQIDAAGSEGTWEVIPCRSQPLRNGVRSNRVCATVRHVDNGKWMVSSSGTLAAGDNEEVLVLRFKRITVLSIGAGNRGSIYALYSAEHPCQSKVVGVADCSRYRRGEVARKHGLDEEAVFDHWKSAAALPRFADAVVIALPDRLHADVAVAFAAKGYHLLLEKPMATTAEDCQRIRNAVRENNVLLAVCHVMRYTPYSRKIHEIVRSGALGDVVNIQHLEPVGNYHFAHSYVRGNWRNESSSSFSLLAKSCHDIDWILWIMGKKCKSIQSFGSLHHFKADKKPAGAGSRCTDCAVESSCPYSAKKIYLEPIQRGHTGWPVAVIVDDDPTEENVLSALKDGPYGRCVYECDNDVMDNQIVNMQFDDGSTCSFSMIAFTEEICVRKTRIFGSQGELEGDGHTIRVFNFLTRTAESVTPLPPDDCASAMTGHDYGDYFLMRDFVDAVVNDEPQAIMSGPDETLESHLVVFAAEASRLKGSVGEQW